MGGQEKVSKEYLLIDCLVGWLLICTDLLLHVYIIYIYIIYYGGDDVSSLEILIRMTSCISMRMENTPSIVVDHSTRVAGN